MTQKDDLTRRMLLSRCGAVAVTSMSAIALGRALALPSAAYSNENTGDDAMTGVMLTVLYPQPTDVDVFNADYEDHLALFRKNAGIPDDQTPYSLMRFASGPDGPTPFYQVITIPFPSGEALQSAMATPEMQEVAADSVRISAGGTPVIMVGVAA